ncbi:MAG: hypothetical protein IJM36_03470 [Acholeplasmatales bacterium]|nr:hypothetical protein [Acholeplasmatales bacterium]
MADDLIEPLKAYKDFLKDKVKDNAIQYFDELTQKSGIDVEANSQTVKKYREKLKDNESVKQKVRKISNLWTFFIIFSGVITLLGAMSLGYTLYMEEMIYKIISSIVAITGFILLITLIIIRVSAVRKKLKPLKEMMRKLDSAAKALKQLAYNQMSVLNSLYDWNIPATIINKSNDLIHLDKNFNPKRFQQLYEKYGLRYDPSDDTSTAFVQSGEIYGNPFMICKDFRQSWFQKTYTGSITIHWTTTVHTKDGTRVVHHTQTLTASVTRPCPTYYYLTYLMYANDAAPNLVFSRAPSGASGLDDKQLAKMVKKESKQFNKKAERELMDGDPTTNYQVFGNLEFESLYEGIDRNNEVEYRLLFTPLAQKNLIQLIREPKPYGDDWYFNKDKMLNYVQSRHSQSFNYDANPNIFINYSYEDARNKFISYIELYFQSFYYDLLPIISIPIYQLNKSDDYIYKDVYKDNVTCYEQEVMANSFNRKVFAHPESSTDCILKVETESNNGNTDVVKVTAHSFKAIPQVEYVNKMGGDGRMHTIPVHYFIYEPLEHESYMAVGEKDSSRKEYLSGLATDAIRLGVLGAGGIGENSYQRGLFAYVLGDFIEKASVNNAFKTNSSNQTKPTAQDILKAELDAEYGNVSEAIDEAKNSLNNSNIQDSNNNNKGSN